MSLSITVNGIEYIRWKRASVFRSMEAVCGSFSFTSTADESYNFPVSLDDEVKIIVDGTPVLNGYVEGVEGSYNTGDHEITITGRDKLADFVDNSIGGENEFKGPITFSRIIKTVIAALGLNNIEVVDNLPLPQQPFDELTYISAEVGENAFEFLERYARMKQILLTNDGNGNLVLTRSSGVVFPVTLKNKVSANDTNIKSAMWKFDNSKRYNTYTVHGQMNPIAQTANVTVADIVDQPGIAIDGDIRSTRKLAINAEESSDNLTAKDRAIWEANIRRARSLVYTPTVQGHSVSGSLWVPNVLVRVDDDFANIKATMMIKAVTFQQDLSGGTTTKLDLTHKDAYKLQAEQSSRDAITDEVGQWD